MNKLVRKSGLIELTLMFFIISSCSQQASPRSYVHPTGDTSQREIPLKLKVLSRVKNTRRNSIKFRNRALRFKKNLNPKFVQITLKCYSYITENTLHLGLLHINEYTVIF